MARFLAGVWSILAMAAAANGPERATLRESAKDETATRAVVTLKAEGVFRPAPSDDAADKQAGRPYKLKVETRFAFDERVIARDADGRARRAARRVEQAASAVNGEIRPMASALRPGVSNLVVDRRDATIVSASPGGPLTRAELELVQGPGDPLALGDLLPEGPVAAGDSWPVGDLAVRSLSGYDALASGGLTATLQSLDAATARVKLGGTIRGAALGGEGTMRCVGSFTFDRAAGRVDSLTLERDEARKPGPVEAGLEVQSTLGVVRKSVDSSAELAAAVEQAKAASPSDPARELLLMEAPGGRAMLLHDRDWHTFWDDPRRAVLKRLDRGEVVAQCNLAVGPNAGKGRHQDVALFREDIRRALGPRFLEFLGQGEVGDPDDDFRYRVAVHGREGPVGVVWYYYLLAGPDGDQILATFTLGDAQMKAFSDQDLKLMGSVSWGGPKP